MNYMFTQTHIKTLNLSNFNISNVVNMESMFQGNYYLETIIIHSFDTSKVTCMSHMFEQNSYITSLDLSNFVKLMLKIWEVCLNDVMDYILNIKNS